MYWITTATHKVSAYHYTLGVNTRNLIFLINSELVKMFIVNLIVITSSSDQYIPLLTAIINKGKAESVVALCFKRATIVPIFYFLFISKLIEKVVERDIERHLYHNNLHDSYQSSHCRCYSTETAPLESVQ